MELFLKVRIGARMICALIVSMVIALPSGCKDSKKDTHGRIGWPPGAGYLSEASHRPSSPHQVEKLKMKLKIIDAEVDAGKLLLEGSLEIRDAKVLPFNFPGSVITNLCQSPANLNLPDYNGDRCILPYGMTVEVDECGRFVPLAYEPIKQGAPATKDTSTIQYVWAYEPVKKEGPTTAPGTGKPASPNPGR